MTDKSENPSEWRKRKLEAIKAYLALHEADVDEPMDEDDEFLNAVNDVELAFSSDEWQAFVSGQKISYDPSVAHREGSPAQKYWETLLNSPVEDGTLTGVDKTSKGKEREDDNIKWADPFNGKIPVPAVPKLPVAQWLAPPPPRRRHPDSKNTYKVAKPEASDLEWNRKHQKYYQDAVEHHKQRRNAVCARKTPEPQGEGEAGPSSEQATEASKVGTYPSIAEVDPLQTELTDKPWRRVRIGTAGSQWMQRVDRDGAGPQWEKHTPRRRVTRLP